MAIGPGVKPILAGRQAIRRMLYLRLHSILSVWPDYLLSKFQHYIKHSGPESHVHVPIYMTALAMQIGEGSGSAGVTHSLNSLVNRPVYSLIQQLLAFT